MPRKYMLTSQNLPDVTHILAQWPNFGLLNGPEWLIGAYHGMHLVVGRTVSTW